MQRAGEKIGGLVCWLLARFQPRKRPRPSLAVLERVTLAPRQSLALIEAEGRRILVASSAEGSPAFYALDERGYSRSRISGPRRISW